MKWCELTILAGASSLSDVSNVIYSSIISGVRPLKQEMEQWAVAAAGGGEEC